MSHWFEVALLASVVVVAARGDDDYLTMSGKVARETALSTRMKGQVGKSLDLRILATDRSYNYKLRATWMSPEVIRANARLLQIDQRLSDDDARNLVSAAESVNGTVVLVELDPREGSGVIPRDWQAVLRAQGSNPERAVRGQVVPGLRDVPALSSAAGRDYSYDVFWVVFPLSMGDGAPLFHPVDAEAELIVKIYAKVGKVRWPIPASLRRPVSPQ